MVHSRPIFFIFVFSIVQLVDKISPMSGFEPWIFDVGSNRSINWATITAIGTITMLVSQIYQLLEKQKRQVGYNRDLISFGTPGSDFTWE